MSQDDPIHLLKPFPGSSKGPGRSCRRSGHSFSHPTYHDFPPLFPNEPPSSRSLRADAYQVVWNDLSSRLDAIQSSANQPTFQSVGEFVLGGEPSSQIPLGLLHAGGVNASDHTGTLSALRGYLEEKGCITSMVTARELSGSPGSCRNAIDKISKELSDGFSGNKKSVQGGTSGKRKRKRESGAKGPLVVVVADVEGVDPVCLSDFVVGVSDLDRIKERVRILMGVSTDAEALRRCLLPWTWSRVACTPFELACSRKCMEDVFKLVLLAPDVAPIVLGKGLTNALIDQNLHHDSTVEGFKQGLLMACTEYFGGQVLSGYLNAYCPQKNSGSCLPEIAFDWNNVPPELNSIAANALSLEDGEDLKEVLNSWVSHTMGWKVGLLWMNQLAVGLGKLTRASGCTLRDVYCMAVTDGLENSPAFKMVDRLSTDIGLPKLSDAEISELLKQLEAIAMDYLPKCPMLQPYLSEIQKFHLQLGRVSTSIPDTLTSTKSLKSTQPIQESITQNTRAHGSTKKKFGYLKPLQTSHKAGEAGGKLDALQISGRKSLKARRDYLLASFDTNSQAKASDEVNSSIAVHVADFLRQSIKMLCGSPPESIRGFQVFCLKGGNAVGSHLLGTPRFLVEEALLKPQDHLKRGLSIISDEDLCVGYQILVDNPGERLGLADWLVSFASHFGKNLLSTDCQPIEKRSQVKQRRSSHKEAKHGRDAKDSDTPNCTPTAEYLIRFERVLLELQHIGFIKKTGDMARCLIFNE